jgi:hypothetical protein
MFHDLFTEGRERERKSNAISALIQSLPARILGSGEAVKNAM